MFKQIKSHIPARHRALPGVVLYFFIFVSIDVGQHPAHRMLSWLTGCYLILSRLSLAPVGYRLPETSSIEYMPLQVVAGLQRELAAALAAKPQGVPGRDSQNTTAPATPSSPPDHRLNADL